MYQPGPVSILDVYEESVVRKMLDFWGDRCPVLATFQRYRAASSSVVVLMSGGLDSAVLATACCRAGLDVVALTATYGQRHDVEVAAARRIAASLGVRRHEHIDLPWLGRMSGSSLTTSAADGAGEPVTSLSAYVPGRNLMMLAGALAVAESVGSRVVLAGATKDDVRAFPDCRPTFFEAVSQAATLGTLMGQNGRVVVEAPFSRLRKAQVVQLGSVLEAPMAMSHSCYAPVDNSPCGVCAACSLRIQAFEEAGETDHAEAPPCR